MPLTFNRPFVCPRLCGDTVSVHPKTVSNHRCLQNKRGTNLSDTQADAPFHIVKFYALKKLRTSDGWSMMSLQAQQLIEPDEMRELEEAQTVKKARHEVEWMAKLVTGQMEPDDVGGGQVVDGELVETNDGGGAQSMVVGDTRCTEAFMLVEARYQDEESDEWTTDIDYVETIRVEIL